MTGLQNASGVVRLLRLMSLTSAIPDGAPTGATAPNPAAAQNRIALAAAALLALGALALGNAFSWRQGAFLLLGAFLGVTLYHAAFGFTSSWRVFIADRRGAGLRAQMIMLAIAVVLFFPTLAGGTLFGQPVRGEASPVGVSVVFGAFLFGVGMQLGGGCASGTLYTVGGGSLRMVVTLAAFVAGSTIGARHLPWWSATPNIGPVSIVKQLGWAPALALHLALFAAIALLTVVLERRRHGALPARPRTALGWRTFTRGPWPLVWGAVALAAGNFATLALAGRPWGVTSAFALWGSKLAGAAGVDVASWGYWTAPARRDALAGSVLGDVTSVMDFGIIVGALLAAALARKFAPTWKVPARSLVAAVIGGLLLGYGARLAYGCNIGAYFSGIASSSLHGWVWLVAAFTGNVLGTRLRPVFGLAVERTSPA
ncbi:MAG TPA: YeeE/YedE family protein [Anaeromyxobacteraceae bacterium]|nr:YeeE/YedE family protein [Anaeromyxobacteraceae bacterium]